MEQKRLRCTSKTISGKSLKGVVVKGHKYPAFVAFMTIGDLLNIVTVTNKLTVFKNREQKRTKDVARYVDRYLTGQLFTLIHVGIVEGKKVVYIIIDGGHRVRYLPKDTVVAVVFHSLQSMKNVRWAFHDINNNRPMSPASKTWSHDVVGPLLDKAFSELEEINAIGGSDMEKDDPETDTINYADCCKMLCSFSKGIVKWNSNDAMHALAKEEETGEIPSLSSFAKWIKRSNVLLKGVEDPDIYALLRSAYVRTAWCALYRKFTDKERNELVRQVSTLGNTIKRKWKKDLPGEGSDKVGFFVDKFISYSGYKETEAA